jgi:diguanylate cyclase (GGDEF)-like protein
MDVDQFKKFNDTHGHNLGDEILRMIAHTIRYALRATDSFGRWGGEEFIAILQDVGDENSLYAAAEKIRTLVQHSRLDVGGKGLTVTLSIGATLMLSEDTPGSFINRADQLMYLSKQSGRNRTTIG